MANNMSLDPRVDSIINLLTEFSRGNFSAREDVSDHDDALSAVASGLNMFGEELAHLHHENNRQREFLQNIVSSVDEVVYARTLSTSNPADSPFTFISDRALDIIGHSVSELEKMPALWIDVIHPDEREECLRRLQAMSRGLEIVSTYRVFHDAKNEYRWIEDRMVPGRGKDGQIVEVYGSARDITDQRNITIDLEEKNELISRIINSSDQAFYIIAIDPENSFKNTCTYLSEQIEKIQGSTPEYARNNPLFWIQDIHPDDISSLKEINRKMFSSKKPVTRVYRIKHARTGEYVWVEDNVVPILDGDGTIKEFYGSARDITIRKKTELEREKLVLELSKKNDELLQFNNIVSHNLRSPVASIMGLAQFIQEELPKDELQTVVAYILKAATALDETLRDLNVILSAGGLVKEEIFSLSELIDAVRAILRRQVEETGARIVVAIDPAADNISSFKSYIHSAIYNLVSNAIKYRSESQTPVIKISAHLENGRTVICVSDNGLGIDLVTHQHKIFTLFSRLHTHREGKGLGLYMTKRQIESLNGTLSVESEEGVGTTFTITL